MTVFRFSNLRSHIFKYISYTELCIRYCNREIICFLVWKKNMFREKTAETGATIERINPFFKKNCQTSFSFLLYLSTDIFFVDKSPIIPPISASSVGPWRTLPALLIFFWVSFLNPYASPALAALTTRIFTTNIVVHSQRVTHLYSLVKECKPQNNQECAIKHQHACAKFSKASPVLNSLPVAQSILSCAVPLDSFYVS